MSVESLLALHDKVREDRWRVANPFSDDLQQAGRAILKPFAYDYEVAEVLREWCMKRQPCQFGRAAANRGRIYFSVLRERDLADGDESIRQKIDQAKRHWKQRALSDTKSPPHSFVLLFASNRVMLAAPDENLRRFADRLLDLAGWAPSRRAKRGDNAVSSDFLYLQNPANDVYHGFQFNIDFFASAGDRRWWHDHRVAGGIAFTANSVGHMKAFLDWYTEKGGDDGEWAVKQAMITIAQAHPTKGGDTKASAETDPRAEGRLTWLRELDAKGRPLVPHLACPIKSPPKQLLGKDWTKYEGLVHTDQAVREELFADREEPITGAAPYIQDLTYLFDRSQEDFINFTSGKVFAEDDVFADIGGVESWTHRVVEQREEFERSPEEVAEMAELLGECRAWGLSEDYLEPEQAV